MTHPAVRRAGFTLIELLGVVAIIAILIGLLLDARLRPLPPLRAAAVALPLQPFLA